MPARYLSPAISDQDALALVVVPLVGAEATIYNDLWNAVINQSLRPGDKLEEVAMSEIYGVSRTVIRKVLVIMEQEGAVSLPLNRGAYVALPSPRDALELCEAVGSTCTYIVGKLADQPQIITTEQRGKLALHVQAETEAAELHTIRRLHMEHAILLALIYGNLVLATQLERAASRLALALSAYQGVTGNISTVQYTAALNQMIFDGRKEEALLTVNAAIERARKSMRFAVATGSVDLKAILGRG
ncbi:GntR family transcriptional regulator [Aminobacter sp. BE322]|uniref:GntR family transcriptional regulator n=1 Tax=unclassified Aminobacter TaxID=2644704 RepID=UPI003D1CFACF